MPYKDAEMQRAYQRVWSRGQRQKNPDYNQKRTKWSIAHARRRAEWLLSLKRGLSCLICGESHPGCIDFHHRDPKAKLFGICKGTWSQYSKCKILAEIEKCDVLCANCHRKLHWEQRHDSAEKAE